MRLALMFDPFRRIEALFSQRPSFGPRVPMPRFQIDRPRRLSHSPPHDTSVRHDRVLSPLHIGCGHLSCKFHGRHRAALTLLVSCGA